MKVLTVKQPYASLLAEGIKEYEFRIWNGYAFKLTNVEKIDNILEQGNLSFWNFNYTNE